MKSLMSNKSWTYTQVLHTPCTHRVFSSVGSLMLNNTCVLTGIFPTFCIYSALLQCVLYNVQQDLRVEWRFSHIYYLYRASLQCEFSSELLLRVLSQSSHLYCLLSLCHHFNHFPFSTASLDSGCWEMPLLGLLIIPRNSISLGMSFFWDDFILSPGFITSNKEYINRSYSRFEK